MSARKPTSLSIATKLNLVLLAIFDPSEFERREVEDAANLENAPRVEATRVEMVRNSYFGSLILVVTAILAGWAVAQLGKRLGCQSSLASTVTGIIGTALLLWATVAVRGWEVASFSTSAFGERLNTWIFRSLYWLGTMWLVVALFLQMAGNN